ncbi:MAG: D-erythronate dehydrogenase [Pseudomonadota bacterium]
MHVVITGGSGFLGQRVVRTLAERGTIAGRSGGQKPITGFTLIDTAEPAFVAQGGTAHVGDITDAAFLAQAVPANTTHVFHLAAVVSGQAEAEYDTGIQVNLRATEQLLDLLRQHAATPRVVFTSSVAVFGDAPAIIEDSTAALPRSSYGTQKAMAELLINDMSRKGFIDGISLRVPTVVVRPGKPNAAASSFASAIIREPLSGERAACPVDPGMLMWIASPDAVTRNLVHAADLPADDLGFPRILNLPGLSVPVSEMIAAMVRAGGAETLIDHQIDPAIEDIVGTWPDGMNTLRANELGFVPDDDIDAIVAAYSEDSGQ